MDIYELEQFGSSVLERKSLIERLVPDATDTFPISLQGNLFKLPVISVRIGLPVYRLANGRTVTYQLEYIEKSTDPNVTKDFFTRDNDARDAQLAQHKILERLINDELLLKSFKDESEFQVEPLLCTNTGVVVNGNRRLCAWRKLYLQDKKRYKSFETVRIAILPELDENAILDIEEKLQVKKEKRSEYKWHALATMAERRLKSGMSTKDVANCFDKSSQAINVLIEARRMAEKYLEWINKPNSWSDVDKDQYGFEEFVKGKKKISNNQGKQELFQQLVFEQIKAGGEGDRLYNTVKEIASNIDAISEKLQEKYDIKPEDSGNKKVNLLAGTNIKKDIDCAVVKKIQSEDIEKKELLKTVHGVVEDQKFLRRAAGKKTILVEQLSKASSDLHAAINQGLVEDADLSGVKEQLKQLRESINSIEAWVDRQS